jgi:hypothetical protein
VRLGRVITKIAVFFGLAILALSFVLPVQDTVRWVDPTTGSTKRQYSIWPFFRMPAEIRPSPLADWLARREGSVAYRWKYLSNHARTIWGTVDCFGDGAAPPIYRLHPFTIGPFVEASSDEELAQFTAVMRNGTMKDQESAVKAAEDKVSAQWSSGVPKEQSSPRESPGVHRDTPEAAKPKAR